MNAQLSPTSLAELTSLLAACFEAGELRRFVELLPSGRTLSQNLPGEAVSMAELVAACVALCQRHAVLNAAWFAALGEARPGRKHDIDALAARVLSEIEDANSQSSWPLTKGVLLRHQRYRLERQLGSGAYGDVWEAQDVRTATSVAIKFLRRSGDLLDENRRRRFFEGAEEISRVDHPSVVKILEKRCEEGGHDFYVMEFVRGRSLRSLILSGVRSSVSNARAIKILRRLGEALIALHHAGVVHRDVSPNNTMIGDNDDVKLIDFDFVRRLASPETRTTSGGTWVYAAPETAGAGEVDARADIFGLAMIGVFMLYGRELPAKCYHPRELPGFITDLAVSPRIRLVLREACEWEPRGRHSTMEKFCAELAAADESSSSWVDSMRLVPQPVLRFGAPALLLGGALALWISRTPPGLLATHPALLCPVRLDTFATADTRTAYTVPEPCNEVHVRAWGGGGGGAGLHGGSGGFAEARLRVATAEVLTVAVGNGGSHWGRGGVLSKTGGATGGMAGFAGAASGGFSGVQAADLSWLLIAGGGGGASGHGAGGGGGGENGEDGAPHGSTSGLGGSQKAPGKGGGGFHGGSNGNDGNGMEGGPGGHYSASNQGESKGVGGGAGGGGYMGGGGGGSDGRDIGMRGVSTGGGGGGSGFIEHSRVVNATRRLLQAEGDRVPANDDPFYVKGAGQGGRHWPPYFDPVTFHPVNDEGASGNPGLVVLLTHPYLSSGESPR